MEACKEIIMIFAAALGDSRPDLEKAISDALEKANEICLDTDTVGTNVSNPKDRIEQFKLNTPQGPYAQKFWIMCSRLIAEKLSHFIRTQSNYSCPPSTVKISNQSADDPESDELLNSNAELFIYLGFARFQLENLLNKIKKDPIANIFSTSSVSFYVDLSSRPIDQLAGVFSPQKELNCRQQQYLQEVALAEGPFTSAYEKLPILQNELEEKYKNYPNQYVLEIKGREIPIFSNHKLDIQELKSTLENCTNITLKYLHEGVVKIDSLAIFINIESNKDTYVICKHHKSYQKFYIPSENKEQIFTLGQISYPEEFFWRDSVLCQHKAPYFKMWPFIMEKFTMVCNAIKNQESEVECLQKIGQFLFFYINIMPYRKGSAAIGEWLMRGFFHARGLAMGDLNSQLLSWDFNAFAYLSPEEYGEKFQDFFTEINKK